MRQAPYISQSNDKDDPGDAYKLAELLCWKPWLLHPIQYRREQTQADLSWIRAPAAFAESRKQLINTVRAFSKPGAQSLVHPPEAQNLVPPVSAPRHQTPDRSGWPSGIGGTGPLGRCCRQKSTLERAASDRLEIGLTF
jgi:hypothetical protein